MYTCQQSGHKVEMEVIFSICGAFLGTVIQFYSFQRRFLAAGAGSIVMQMLIYGSCLVVLPNYYWPLQMHKHAHLN